MPEADLYGLRLTGASSAVAAYNRGVGHLLRLRSGSVEAIASSVALDPTFALGHAALALLGHEFCAPVDIEARLRDARLHASRSSERERSHVYAVDAHLAGDSRPLIAHLAAHPRDALLLSTAVPTIAFAGVTSVPAEAWAIVEGAAPAYGDNWWFQGLLAFVRQEQHRFDEAMELSCRSLGQEPGAGHSAHARTHAHYETADHVGGLAWIDGWITGDGASIDSVLHFSWHAALHELSLGDLDAVRRRYTDQLRPGLGQGCRGLVDVGSLLWRWQLTPDAQDVPTMASIRDQFDDQSLLRPATAFMALHAAVALLALEDHDALGRLRDWATGHPDPVQSGVVAPLAGALASMASGHCSSAADQLERLTADAWRLGGSDAQREVIEETRIHALLRAGRYGAARDLLDRRLDRRRCQRDVRWRAVASSGLGDLVPVDGDRDLGQGVDRPGIAPTGPGDI
ncbi:FAD-dependent pyridine nucleotide-disulfide oxidoreductase [metagenome]|uniref:FAD-dependent pyridine nucleotide-disulfide oxidoreductase n=1 Tax=metagenome TaxID=256318 RepID=A0A2P2C5R3_9ZZZZ